MEVSGDIESLERSIARGYAVNRHEEFGLRDINEKVAFVGVVEMPGQFHGFTAERNRPFRFEGDVRQQSIGIVHFLQEVGDTFKSDDLQALNVLECCRAADMIFVDMRIDENFDRLVRDLADGCRNVLPETGRRIEYDDAIISDEKGGLPAIVGDDVNPSADIFNCIADSRV